MNGKIKYLTPEQVYKQFGYYPKTTAELADLGKIECIRSPGGHRRYPESAFIKTVSTDKERVLYARVSTKTQLLDLDTQIDFLSKTYPGCRVVKNKRVYEDFQPRDWSNVAQDFTIIGRDY
ncbi:hypothetical protein [Dolichospermum compactum]|uniref:Resolvase domain protein n=1 Tax=Dolichospermum compactum NIES-806 TaxID=1973481 RepID=A0A1Z4V8I5_9CYAN|nr:hypothetical protein [Dolichospermum compactum]BAZ87852.1 resolvase domain protein [Dolichospermum compactum NIES-806]